MSEVQAQAPEVDYAGLYPKVRELAAAHPEVVNFAYFLYFFGYYQPQDPEQSNCSYKMKVNFCSTAPLKASSTAMDTSRQMCIRDRRSYHHGQTVVPAGCAVTPYEKRYDAMEGMDLVLSATTSPHYTVAAYELAELARPPKVLVDLAIPRDIEPGVGELPGFTLYNVDDLGVEVCRDIPPEAEEILEKYLSQPVSYTHLDVYKRQPLQWTRFFTLAYCLH